VGTPPRPSLLGVARRLTSAGDPWHLQRSRHAALPGTRAVQGSEPGRVAVAVLLPFCLRVTAAVTPMSHEQAIGLPRGLGALTWPRATFGTRSSPVVAESPGNRSVQVW